jgi:hypothetical protein
MSDNLHHYTPTQDGQGWILPDAVDHPTTPHAHGNLVWYPATRLYCLLVNGAVLSVPQDWARATVHPMDAILVETYNVPG